MWREYFFLEAMLLRASPQENPVCACVAVSVCARVCTCVYFYLAMPIGVNVDTACEFTNSHVIYPFAYRTHAHSLGKKLFFLRGVAFSCHVPYSFLL